jgi:hypothetical protein
VQGDQLGGGAASRAEAMVYLSPSYMFKRQYILEGVLEMNPALN